MRSFRVVALVGLTSLGLGCLSARVNQRSYYVLGAEPIEAFHTPLFTGLVRVRDMDSDSIYDKFQIVVRKSPYELNYSEQNVWAVKPNRMVSDIIALTLDKTNTFAAVTRELGEVRPDYVLAGDLHSIEIYDSGDVWYAHLSISLRLTRFNTGETLFTHSFEARKRVQKQRFSHAVRGASELLSAALIEGLDELRQKYGLPRKDDPQREIRKSSPIYIPEGAPDPSDLPPLEDKDVDAPEE